MIYQILQSSNSSKMGLVAGLAFMILALVILAYLALESQGNLWDLLSRATVLIAVIPV